MRKRQNKKPGGVKKDEFVLLMYKCQFLGEYSRFRLCFIEKKANLFISKDGTLMSFNIK